MNDLGARQFASKLAERLFEIEKLVISDYDSCELAFGVVKTMIYELRRDVEAGFGVVDPDCARLAQRSGRCDPE